MIPFFRKIRKKMADDNKPMKYMRYAIGEILLVVIGILIALQINNGNIERLNNIEEQKILHGLLNEFEFNLSSINQALQFNLGTSNSCHLLTDMIRNNTLFTNTKTLDSLIVTLGAFASFDARRGVSDEIINSGKLNIIANNELKIYLTRWSGLLTDASEDTDFRAVHYSSMLMPFLIKYFPLANGELYKTVSDEESDKALRNYNYESPFKAKSKKVDLMELENMIWIHKYNHDYIILNDYEIKEFILETIDLIKQGLK